MFCFAKLMCARDELRERGREGERERERGREGEREEGLIRERERERRDR